MARTAQLRHFPGRSLTSHSRGPGDLSVPDGMVLERSVPSLTLSSSLSIYTKMCLTEILLRLDYF